MYVYAYTVHISIFTYIVLSHTSHFLLNLVSYIIVNYSVTGPYNMQLRFTEAQHFAYHLGRSYKWGTHSSQCDEMVIILYSVADSVVSLTVVLFVFIFLLTFILANTMSSLSIKLLNLYSNVKGILFK